MRLVSKISAVALALAATASVSAQAQSIDVRVIGTITPAACTPTIGSGGVIDYGNIPASSLSATSYNKLDERALPFSITCDAPTRVALLTVDNRAASRVPGITRIVAPVSDNGNFGLGTVSGANVGGYVVRMRQGTFTMDGVPAVTIGSGNGGVSWGSAPEGPVYHDVPRAPNSWSTGGNVPTAFTNLAGTLSVQAVLNKGEALPLTDAVPLDGLATIELLYL